MGFRSEERPQDAMNTQDLTQSVTLPVVLTEQELCELLKVEHDSEQVAYWVQRRGLPCVVFRHDGRVNRRFPTQCVLKWLTDEATRRSRSEDGDPG